MFVVCVRTQQSALQLPPSMGVYLKLTTAIERSLEEDLLSVTLWPKVRLKLEEIYARTSTDLKQVSNQQKAQIKKNFLCGLPAAPLPVRRSRSVSRSFCAVTLCVLY